MKFSQEVLDRPLYYLLLGLVLVAWLVTILVRLFLPQISEPIWLDILSISLMLVALALHLLSRRKEKRRLEGSGGQ
jgi:hypothetical protein